MSLEVDLKTLGLSPGASWDDVKSAFRRLARTYHPDVAGPEHSRRFAEINRAYMSIREAVQSGSFGALGQTGGAKAASAQGTARDAASGTWQTRRSRRRRRSGGFSWGAKGLSWLSSIGSVLAKGAMRFGRSEGVGKEEAKRSFERDRALWEALDLAENRLDWILKRARPAEGHDISPRLESRLLSRHPGVVVLALEELRKLEDLGLRERLAVLALSRGMPDGEVLSRVLSIFKPSAAEVARSVCRWGGVYGRPDAVGVLRWLKYGGVRDRGLLKPFCGNRDLGVLAALLDMWPSGVGLPDVSDMSRFLKSEDEGVLGAALRLVKREGPQPWMMPRIEKLASSHPSPAVRVWASAIVRNRSMG